MASSSSCPSFSCSDAAAASRSSASHIGIALLEGVARVRSSEPATICDGRVRSGGELLQRVAALSTGLRTALGLQAGDRVAIAALNSDWYLEWLLAVPCAGGIIAPLNYRWSSEEASNAARQIDPAFLVIDKHCTPLGLEIKKHMPSVTLITLGDAELEGTTFVDAESIYMGLTEEVHLPLFLAPDGIALICFTSGTTGMPKGAAITHSALIVQSLAKIQVVQYSSSDVYLHTSPLCHIGGISSAHAMVLAGGCHIFQPRFQASAVLKSIRQHQVTAMITIPTMLMDLTSNILSRTEGDVEWSIRTILNGAGSLSFAAFEKAVKAFPAALLLSAYGMTEACSSISFLILHNPQWETSAQSSEQLSSQMSIQASHGYCVGKPASHVELSVRSESCGSPAGSRSSLGEGSILVKGPQMMKKYWGNPEHTSLNDSGWFDTGDVGWMDEQGRLWLLSRKKDIVKSGGENVYCCEVENILSRHPAVTGVSVVGVKDMRLGEMVGAAILLKEGWNWEEEAQFSRRTDGHIEYVTASGTQEGVVSPALLRLHCRQQGLSRFKVPKVWMRKSSPFTVTSSGKVRKDVVREELAVYYSKGQAMPRHSKL